MKILIFLFFLLFVSCSEPTGNNDGSMITGYIDSTANERLICFEAVDFDIFYKKIKVL